MFKFKKELEDQIKKLDQYVNEQASLKECLLCGAKMTSACNSHVVPTFILKNIAEDGNVAYSHAISKINYSGLKKITGRRNAYPFRMICKECDNKYFRNYENIDKLYNFQTLNKEEQSVLMREMALKTHLAHIDMKNKKRIRIYAMGLEKKYKSIVKAAELDIAEHNGYVYSIKHWTFVNENPFYLIYSKELPYKTNIATQTIVNYCYDLQGKQVFDPTILENINQCRYFYLMILPFEDKTLVVFYIEKNNKNNVDDIIEQFNDLSEEEKLHFIFISLMIHDQQFYMSPSLADYINNYDKRLARLYMQTEYSKYQKSISKFRKYNNYLTENNSYQQWLNR